MCGRVAHVMHKSKRNTMLPQFTTHLVEVHFQLTVDFPSVAQSILFKLVDIEKKLQPVTSLARGCSPTHV